MIKCKKTSVDQDIRRIIHKRDKYICYFCKEHIIIKKAGTVIHHLHYPARSFSDLVTCCRGCNTRTHHCSDKSNKKLIFYHSKGFNDTEIAKKLNVTSSAISQRRKSVGLKSNYYKR